MKAFAVILLALCLSSCCSYEFSQRSSMRYAATLDGAPVVDLTGWNAWWANAKANPTAAITSLVTDGAAAYAEYKAGMAAYDHFKPAPDSTQAPAAIPAASGNVYNFNGSGPVTINQAKRVR